MRAARSRSTRRRSIRYLPDGTPLSNRLLAALPTADYDRIVRYIRMNPVTVGETLQAHRVRITDVYFPNGGVFSVTNEMRNGALVEVATVGREGMLGIGVFFGDRAGIGRTFQQVANGSLPSMSVQRFLEETAAPGPFRDVVSIYAQANLLQIMQCTACNALHDLTSRLSRILLLSADRCADDIQLSQESLAEMLGVRRSSVTTAAAILRGAGAIDYRRAVIKILDREKLRNMVCECYSTIRHTIDVGFNTHPSVDAWA